MFQNDIDGFLFILVPGAEGNFRNDIRYFAHELRQLFASELPSDEFVAHNRNVLRANIP